MPAPAAPLTDPITEERKRKVTFAKFKSGAWTIALAVAVVVLFVPLISEAIRTQLPMFGAKLSKAAIIGPLFGGRAMAKVDVAYIASIVFYAVVIYFWRELLRLWLDPDATTELNEQPYRVLITICGLLVLVIDTVLMYIAISTANWGKVGLSFVAIGFTLTYLVGLVFASLVSMNLKRTIKKLEEEL